MQGAASSWLALLFTAIFCKVPANSVSMNAWISWGETMNSIRALKLPRRRGAARSGNEDASLQKNAENPHLTFSATRAWSPDIFQHVMWERNSTVRRRESRAFTYTKVIFSFEGDVESNSSTFINWPMTSVSWASRESPSSFSKARRSSGCFVNCILATPDQVSKPHISSTTFSDEVIQSLFAPTACAHLTRYSPHYSETLWTFSRAVFSDYAKKIQHPKHLQTFEKCFAVIVLVGKPGRSTEKRLSHVPFYVSSKYRLSRLVEL